MSTRPQLDPYKLVVDGDMSADIVSPATIVLKLSQIVYGFSWAGTTPVGAITLECSNDYKLDPSGAVANAGTWNTMPLSATCAVLGNTGSGIIDVTATGNYAIRVKYTKTSGTGLMQVIVNAKVA